MIDMLAQAANESTGTIPTIGAVVASVLLALGGREGIVAIHSKRKNRNGHTPVSAEQCAERRAVQEKAVNDRHQEILRVLTRMDESLSHVHERIDDLYKRP